MLMSLGGQNEAGWTLLPGSAAWFLATGRERKSREQVPSPCCNQSWFSSSHLPTIFSAFWLTIPHFHSSALAGASHGSMVACPQYQVETRDLALPDREPNTTVPFYLSKLGKEEAPDQHSLCQLLS